MPKNFAHEPKLWARDPEGSDERNPQRRRLKRRLDGRTREGKEVNRLKRELEALHPHPDAITASYLTQALALKQNICTLEDKVLSGKGTLHDTRHYLAWVNSFRRCLAALRYGDANKAVRQLAESRMMVAASRLAK
jgi:hypothetical protein